MTSAGTLILGLCAVWLLGSLGVTSVFGAIALRGRRSRRSSASPGTGKADPRRPRKFRTSGRTRPAPAPAFGHADLLAAVPGAFMLDRELDLLALRLNPLYYGAPNVVRPERQRAHAVRAAITRRNGDDRRYAELPDHDDWKWTR